MKIAHVAVWCRDLERAAAFWKRYFKVLIEPRFLSIRFPGFASRFVRFSDGGAIELMTASWLGNSCEADSEQPGWVHVAIALESEEEVDCLAERLQIDGYLVKAPHHTEDGYYEAVARDTEGNLVEITS